MIGGGAAGLLAAGTAARSGARVTVIERNDRPGKKILGVELKTERGRRVFPRSDKSADILSALLRYASGCRFLRAKATGIRVENGRVAGVETADGSHPFDVVILATGGASYPLTGSDGSGYALARDVGHTVTEMLFTHFGMSGPMILSASAHLRSADFTGVRVEIDLKPALDEQTLERRLLSDFSKYVNRDAQNALSDLLPQKMILPFLTQATVDPRKKINALTRAERASMLHTLKHFSIPVSGFRPIEEAIVTSGGVSVKEIDPKTMGSRLVDGLFFAGEVIDVDAYTGGFNLQIAFSTGYVAGQSAAENRSNDKK